MSASILVGIDNIWFSFFNNASNSEPAVISTDFLKRLSCKTLLYSPEYRPSLHTLRLELSDQFFKLERLESHQGSIWPVLIKPSRLPCNQDGNDMKFRLWLEFFLDSAHCWPSSAETQWRLVTWNSITASFYCIPSSQPPTTYNTCWTKSGKAV